MSRMLLALVVLTGGCRCIERRLETRLVIEYKPREIRDASVRFEIAPPKETKGNSDGR